MSWSIATWNVNSIKARQDHVLSWLQDNPVDILALQELKTLDFCPKLFEAIGYNAEFVGQKAYNGVALLSKKKVLKRPIKFLVHAPEDQARFLAVEFENCTVVCVYVPNGSEVGSDKYLYKLAWLDALEAWFVARLQKPKDIVILGDFNIAPEDSDVYDPKVWQGKILASDKERQRLANLINLGLVDLKPDGEGRFTWWDYRAGAFAKDKGCRIDLILANTNLAKQILSTKIDPKPRSWDKPSDHCPVIATFMGNL